MSEGSRTDWPYFARWHYRSHHLAFVKRVVMLWHGEQPIGICVFGAPAASLSLRSQFFGLLNPRNRLALQSLNKQLWLLARVVLHPSYRGAGIAAAFVRRACATCPVKWIETLSAMGTANPFFERAGFKKVGMIRKEKGLSRREYAGAYGQRGVRVKDETVGKSRYSEVGYWVRENQKDIEN